MIRLNIDGQQIEVADGSTILEAARTLGIDIPTLCHLPEIHGNTSCMLCAVQVTGHNSFLPSCSIPVEEGMEVVTENAVLEDYRRTTLELLFSEHTGECLAPCQVACPAHLDVPTMMSQIASERFDDAIYTIKQTIALPAVLGYICPAPCENACRRNQIDNSASICLLKKSVAEKDYVSKTPYLPKIAKSSGKRVAIIGAGPAGLATAYYATQAGHACTIFDDHELPGGMLRYGIPEDILPRKILDQEIDQILALGISFRPGSKIETTVQLADLRSKYDAVVLTIGNVEEVEAVLGLEKSSRGIQINLTSFATAADGIFAGGDCVHPRRLAVQAVAHGRQIAESINQYLTDEPVIGIPQRTNSRLKRLNVDELSLFLKSSNISPNAWEKPDSASGNGSIIELAQVCLQCGCRSAEDCQLRLYSDRYGANPQRYRNNQAPVERIDTHPQVFFEPGKCIKCGLCVAISEQETERLGLTFIGRGFDVRIGVPFDDTLEAGLAETAEACIAACPTGAIAKKEKFLQ